MLFLCNLYLYCIDMKDFILLDSVRKYNDLFGLETLHPLITVVDLSEATKWEKFKKMHYGLYAIFLKDTRCGNIIYGRQVYDYDEGTVVSFAPGQVVEMEVTEESVPRAYGILFHPDFIRGTSLGQDIKKYSFFSYESNEALHLSESENAIFMDCLRKIDLEIKNGDDKFSRRLILDNIRLLLDYCMRFYDRQFTTRKESNKDIIVRFERLLDDYFDGKNPKTNGLPTVKYFADKVFLSPNYFGDLVSRHTGKTVSEYIQNKIIDSAKDLILSTPKSMSEISYTLGFQYPQHMSRMFKRIVGCTPIEYRTMTK